MSQTPKFTDYIGITITNAYDQEKGFFHGEATWKHPSSSKEIKAGGFGRGRERAVAYALDSLATELRRVFPEYPTPEDA